MKPTLSFLIAVLFGQTVFAQNSLFTEEIGQQFTPKEQTKHLHCETSATVPTYTIPTGNNFSISTVANNATGTTEILNPQRGFKHSRNTAMRSHAWYPRYQGEISLAYGQAIGGGESSSYSRIILETVHGARISQYVFVGAGLAINYCFEDMITVDVENHMITKKARGTLLPLFANAKGYLPVSGKVALYLSCDIGAAFDLSDSFEEKTKLYAAAGPGVTFGRQNGGTLGDFSVRFQYIGEDLNAILFRIGVNF